MLFSFYIMVIILFQKNFTKKNGIWLNLSAIYLHCTLYEESCTVIWEFRPPAGHPRHGWVRFFNGQRWLFWNETSFQEWFLLTDLFYFYIVFTLFFLVFSSSSFLLFIFVIDFVCFHIWFIFIIFYFQHTYFFSFASRTSLAPTNTLNDKLDKL